MMISAIDIYNATKESMEKCEIQSVELLDDVAACVYFMGDFHVMFTYLRSQLEGNCMLSIDGSNKEFSRKVWYYWGGIYAKFNNKKSYDMLSRSESIMVLNGLDACGVFAEELVEAIRIKGAFFKGDLSYIVKNEDYIDNSEYFRN